MYDADIVLSPSTSLLAIVREKFGLGDDQPSQVVRYPFHAAPLLEMLDKAQYVHRDITEADRVVDDGDGGDGGEGDIPEVLYYGRLEHRKGVHHLVNVAVRMVSQGQCVRFRFIGGDTQTGPFGRSMREYLSSKVGGVWEDLIVFEEARPREELGQAIQDAAVCCFPSLWENFLNVCLEAMSLGSVVVGSSFGGDERDD